MQTHERVLIEHTSNTHGCVMQIGKPWKWSKCRIWRNER